MFQYLEFLRSQLEARGIDEYAKTLPPLVEMWGKYNIDPAIVFHAWRPVLSAAVRPIVKIGNDGETVIEGVPTTEKTDVPVTNATEGSLPLKGNNCSGDQVSLVFTFF